MNSIRINRALGGLGKAFTPKKVRPNIRSYLSKAGVVKVPYAAFAVVVLFSILVGIAVYGRFIWPSILGMNPLLAGLITLVIITILSSVCIFLVGGIMYFYYDMKIFARTKEMEDNLADYLQVVSTNLKGGMSFERSLFSAIKPRFGVLAQEMTAASKKVITGYDLAAALSEFAEKYESPMLRRSLNLIVGEVYSGGQVSHVIDKVVEGIKKTQKLKMEMATSVLTYVIFIGAIVVVIAPALFALSYNLLSFMAQFTNKLAASGVTSSSLPFTFSEGAIQPEAFKTFSWVATIVVAIFSAMIVSIIERGTIRAGIKYVPVFVVCSIGLYFVFMYILGNVFSVVTI